MSYPHFPNPARRARILEAHQLRQQGLTLREIARIMGCAHSTVAGYLRDYELFRYDLMRELAADQIVTHAIHLTDVEADDHQRRITSMREFRLLLAALPGFQNDEALRIGQLNDGSVHIDCYGNRYAVPDRRFPPTEAEQRQSQEPPRQLPAGRPNPDVVLYCPPITVPIPEPESVLGEDDQPAASEADRPQVSAPPVPVAAAAPPASNETPTRTGETDRIRTKPNKTEQESAPDPAQDAVSADSGQNSPPQSNQEVQTIQKAIDNVDRELQQALSHRDWLNDYPQHNPWHPSRKRAQRLVEKKQALLAQLAQLASASEDPAAA
ncbi:MAG: helix-turn-helix domain-containing protein [Chloroflexi bacterium]|nr:helix-turn-helix domain-containing protein [Chloroflexota bacterium]